MNIEIYEDTYNIAVNQYLSRKTAREQAPERGVPQQETPQPRSS